MYKFFTVLEAFFWKKIFFLHFFCFFYWKIAGRIIASPPPPPREKQSFFSRGGGTIILPFWVIGKNVLPPPPKSGKNHVIFGGNVFFLVVKNRVLGLLGRKKFILKYFVCPQKVTKFSSKHFKTAFFFYEKFVLFTLNYFDLFKIILFIHKWFKIIWLKQSFHRKKILFRNFYCWI